MTGSNLPSDSGGLAPNGPSDRPGGVEAFILGADAGAGQKRAGKSSGLSLGGLNEGVGSFSLRAPASWTPM